MFPNLYSKYEYYLVICILYSMLKKACNSNEDKMKTFAIGVDQYCNIVQLRKKESLNYIWERINPFINEKKRKDFAISN